LNTFRLFQCIARGSKSKSKRSLIDQETIPQKSYLFYFNIFIVFELNFDHILRCNILISLINLNILKETIWTSNLKSSLFATCCNYQCLGFIMKRIVILPADNDLLDIRWFKVVFHKSLQKKSRFQITYQEFQSKSLIFLVLCSLSQQRCQSNSESNYMLYTLM